MKWFLKLAGAILAVTGLAKAFAAIGPARALDAADPLFGMAFRQLFLLVGLSELLIAFICLLTERRGISLLLVASISGGFLAYRLSLWVVGWHRPCGCMGSLTELLHISPGTADNIMKGVLAFLLIGSYVLLLREWGHRRAPEVPRAPRLRNEAALVT
jgi:hypothetical protein